MLAVATSIGSKGEVWAGDVAEGIGMLVVSQSATAARQSSQPQINRRQAWGGTPLILVDGEKERQRSPGVVQREGHC